ncbi:sensor histidine kinase [Erythrobacter donghaensis]|uniref:sensor histidine kinase n=1 Tax=Erythrobacter donghaensis TaxID=267135 RepID=UPI000A3B1884|nr:HAMP domain-containing sensor histidine kinase [Erythrobacter donghaensis]
MGHRLSPARRDADLTVRHSIFARITLLSAALSAVLLCGLWWVTDRTINETIAASLREGVDVDLAGLVDIHASGGREELSRRIADRLALVPSDGARAHYLLADATGARVAGDLAEWPGLDPAVSESGPVRIGRQTEAHARATLLPGNLRLLVAHEAPERAPILSRVALVFGLGGAVFVACIALFAQAAGGRVRQRVAGVNAAFRSGDDQALSALAATDSADEIDDIARQAARALQRDRQLMAAYRETSEQVAHEIRTPLSHLDARLAKALADDPAPATAAHLVAARGEIRQLVGTLEALLDIAASKAKQGQRQGMALVDLSAMTARICELYEDSAEDAGYALSWDIAPDVSLMGDEAQLGRILTNLLDNAFKYNRPGGAIRVVLAPGSRLSVADNGPGIAASERERVFERFWRGPSAQAGDQAGAGLGLALARAIAERHGLTLRVMPSEPGAHFMLAPEEG